MFFLCWKRWISSFQGHLLVMGVSWPSFGEGISPTVQKEEMIQLRSIPINPIWRNDSRSCMFLTSAECFKIFKLPLAVKFWDYRKKNGPNCIGYFPVPFFLGEIGNWWTTFADTLNLASIWWLQIDRKSNKKSSRNERKMDQQNWQKKWQQKTIKIQFTTSNPTEVEELVPNIVFQVFTPWKWNIAPENLTSQ